MTDEVWPPEWHSAALCAQVGGDFWHPERGESALSAKRVCLNCEVRVQCLQWALDHDERFGVFGGYSERERRRIARGEKVALITPKPKPPPPPTPRHIDRTCAHCRSGFVGHSSAKYCSTKCRRRAEADRYNARRRAA